MKIAPAWGHCYFTKLRSSTNGVPDWCGKAPAESQAECVIWTFRPWRKKRKMANYVDEKVASFDSVFDEALKCLEKASSIASTVATLRDCRLEDIECANINSYLRQ